MKKLSIILMLISVLIIASCDLQKEESIDFTEKTIFFASYQVNGEIFAMTPEGEGQQKLISNGIFPRISSNKDKIVYESFEDGDGEIWIANIDGSNKTQLTDNTYKDERPTFSHDGTKILFESDRNGNFDLFTMDLTGGTLTQLTSSADDEQRGEFSSDDSQLTYTVSGITSLIYVSDADGQNAVSVLPNDYYWSWGSHWSPDGNKLAFTAYYGDDQDPYNVIHTMNSDGTNIQALNTSENGQEPFFSPDGTELIFVGFVDNIKQIFKMNSDGTNAIPIISTDYDCFQPYWVW